MAEPLVNQFGEDIARSLGRMLRAVEPRFDTRAFVTDALRGYATLNLMQRGRHIAAALQRHLPQDYDDAIALLLASLDHVPARRGSLASFLFLPYTEFVAMHGLAHFDTSMRALHALTQRFTGEFAIRPFIAADPERVLAQLREWTNDPSEHVRRLVSEGTRPRLPWAARLHTFAHDPAPVLALLERLRDDPSLYVRRSVANHLNDIGKDHPALLADVARQWLVGASPERAWIVRHALRSAVKRGEADALAIMGVGDVAEVAIEQPRVTPARVPIGGDVELRFALRNLRDTPQRVLVDFAVWYVKANGEARAKVFKLRTVDLAAGERMAFAKRLSLVQRTTRMHYPGLHRLDLVLNGRPHPLGQFTLTAE